MDDFEYLQALMGGEEVPPLGSQYQDIWVLTDSSPEDLIVLDQARILAEALGARVQALLTWGQETDALIAAGADRVHKAAESLPHDAEVLLGALTPFLEPARPEFILCADTWLGQEVAPRLAQRLDAGIATRCLELSIDAGDRTLVGVRPAYEGEYYEVVNFAPRWPQMATLVTAHRSQPYLDNYRSGEIETFSPQPSSAPRVRTLGPAPFPRRPMSLEKAPVVVSGGAALGQAGFEKLAALAERLGGAVAGAREAFELGWIEKDRLVDVTGHRIKPRLYMAFGIAGDVMHTAGMQGAGFVVAVHPDPQAIDLLLAALVTR
jgi:electron transfer flavoprotein alpha subunit